MRVQGAWASALLVTYLLISEFIGRNMFAQLRVELRLSVFAMHVVLSLLRCKIRFARYSLATCM